ncbi:hypothetical protein QYM36_010562, partial [Artemia franciscana]
SSNQLQINLIASKLLKALDLSSLTYERLKNRATTPNYYGKLSNCLRSWDAPHVDRKIFIHLKVGRENERVPLTYFDRRAPVRVTTALS